MSKPTPSSLATRRSSPEPLLRVVKKPELPPWQASLLRVGAFLLAIAAGALFILMLGQNPLNVYAEMIRGCFRSKIAIQSTVKIGIPLLVTSLGVTLAFKMKFWNIGAEGQILMGCVASAAMMIYAGNALPTGVLLVLMFLCSFAAGAIWGVIPAFFKAKWNTNETLFTLMLNYVAMQVVTFCIVYWENPVGSNSVGIINAPTKAGWLPPLFGLDYGWNLVIVLLLTVFMFIYMKRTKHGYEISVVGESENTARYAGINVGKVIIRTVGISGGIAGLAGFILVSGSSHTLSLIHI